MAGLVCHGRNLNARDRSSSLVAIAARAVIAIGFTFCILVDAVHAGVGAGGAEVLINTTIAAEQGYPQLAPRGSGFVVVWESYAQDGSGNGIVGRLLDAAGNPIGSEFQINSYSTGAQDSASVASSAAGDFVVVWESFGQDGSTDGVLARRFAANGKPLGDEFLVNTSTVNSQDDPRVAVDFSGDFVVVWEGFNQDGSAASVVLQRYSSAGVKMGGETLVNTYTTGAQLDPDVAMDAFGNIIVVWAGLNQDGSQAGIFGQRFSNTGAAQGTEFQVNSFTTGTQDEPSVAADLAGSFMVAWESNGQDGGANGVFAQRYDAAGAAVGTEFQVNSVSAFSQDDADLSADTNGGFTVAWESVAQDGGLSNGVFVRAFDVAGVPLTSDIQVNITTANSQDDAAIAVAQNGYFAVAWNSFGQDGDAGSIIERHFADGVVTTTTTTTTLPLSPCAALPHSGCKLSAPGRSKLRLRSSPNGSGDISWKFQRGDATVAADFLEPDQNPSAQYHLCVYDAGPLVQPIADEEIPTAAMCGTKPCWNASGKNGYRYRDRDATHGGITRAKLRSGVAQKSQVHVKGKAVGSSIPALPLVFPVSVQLVVDDGVVSNCWQTEFSSALVNTSTRLAAKGP